MLSSPWKLSASRLPTCSMNRSILPCLRYARYSTSGASLGKNIYPCVGIGSFSITRPYPCRAMQRDIHEEERPHVMESSERLAKTNLTEEQDLSENIQSIESEDDKEPSRRKKISHGNKGRVPWNKGRKHSEETRERIRQRTKEALKDPKVRKKMSECPRVLSNQTKAKIRKSLTKLWGKRLQWKRSKEKFLKSWAESIANAAKIGGSDQQELDWDSYDKIKQELALLHINQIAEKAKAKELARIKAERAAQVKAERMAMLAQKRREREESAKARGESNNKRNKKSKEEKEKLAESQEMKLKERLMKIHRKKSTINQVSNQHQRLWEKFDLGSVKGEQLQKEVSLADQIRFARNRRSEQLLDKL